MAALVFAVCLANLLFAERILLSEGLGMDGTNYGAIAARFHEQVFVEGVNEYYLKRAAPSAIVHFGLRLFGQPTDFRHVVLGFQVYNLLLLVAAALLWRGIANELRLGMGARWLGFIALFVNYANIKHAYYMPVFTDVTAFALGTGYAWSWLARRQLALLALTIVGAFCWPIASLSGAILLLFPRRDDGPARPAERTPLPTIASLGIALALLAGFSYMYYVRDLRKVGQGPTIPPIESLVPLAMLVYGAWVFFAYRGLLAGLGVQWILRTMRGVRWTHVAFALVAMAVPALVIRALAAPDVAILNTRGFLRSVIYLPNARPFVNFVSHVVWFGPALWLVVFFWRDIGARARALGPGAIAFLGFALFVALTPESRQSNLACPLLVALLCWTLDERGVPAAVNWFLAITGLALSKFWLRINTDEAVAYALSGQLGFTDEQSATQYRYYYLSQGPWMSNYWYVIQGAVVLALGAALWILVRSRMASRDGAAAVVAPGLPAATTTAPGAAR